MTHDIANIADEVATLFKLQTSSVCAAIALLEAGETVPFIARYRKARTGGMKHAALENLVMRLEKLHAMRERREVMFEALTAQEKLTPELRQRLMEAQTRAVLEDIYLPYASKQRSPAARARDAGLEVLADALLEESMTRCPADLAVDFVNAEAHVQDAEAALAGARHVLLERWAQNIEVVAYLREYFWEHGVVTSTLSPEIKAKKSKHPKKSKSGKNQITWSDYVAADAPIKTMPLRRVHMLFRGRREAALRLSLSLPDATYAQRYLATHLNLADADHGRPAHAWLMDAVRVLWEKKLAPKLEAETLARARSLADDDAIHGLSKQLRDVLFTSPAPRGVTMGLFFERGSGVSVAVVDSQGAVLDATSVFPFSPEHLWEPALAGLAKCLTKHDVHWVVTGNSLGFREAGRLLATLAKRYPDMPFVTVRAHELGASAYAASDEAARALPDVYAPCRAAVSMARRFQNPLEELIHMPLRAMVVAPHQHDMNQHMVARAFMGVITECVNAVGVDVNTASSKLLSYVSGLDAAMAEAIVAYREAHGVLTSREQIKAVPGLTPHAFQQAAGFLRVLGGDNPLDETRIHPESYASVLRRLSENNLSLDDVMGKPHVLDNLDFAPDEEVPEDDLLTVQAMIQELGAPGRDPRPAFKKPEIKSKPKSKPKPKSKHEVTRLEALSQDMPLQGVVRRITSFGAFVDVGAEQLGLVHISALADKFVPDPHQVVSVGDVVQVKVLELDLARRRLGLTMRTQEKPKPAEATQQAAPKPPKKRPAEKRRDATPVQPLNTAMADAFAQLKRS
ncbi:MAG: Tex-like N-terminal domain-containing protein [Legionellaceae bacterium]|nr:Tex-like N-terminal domain-containing protein [Legionellaceae bacterium]